MKTIDLSDYRWEKHGGSYDDDDRLHTNLGPADVTVDFSAKRIGLKVRKDGGEHSYCVSVLLTPSGGWRQDLGRVEGARERRHRSQNTAETPEPRRDCRVGAGV